MIFICRLLVVLMLIFSGFTVGQTIIDIIFFTEHVGFLISAKTLFASLLIAAQISFSLMIVYRVKSKKFLRLDVIFAAFLMPLSLIFVICMIGISGIENDFDSFVWLDIAFRSSKKIIVSGASLLIISFLKGAFKENKSIHLCDIY